MARTISHSFAALTREILFLPREHKIHSLPRPALERARLDGKWFGHNTTVQRMKQAVGHVYRIFHRFSFGWGQESMHFGVFCLV